MTSLRQLVSRQSTLDGGGGGESDGEEQDRAVKREKQQRRDGEADEGVEVASKAVVLESSVELIRQLQAMCARIQQACNAKDQQIARLTSNLDNVVQVCNSAGASHDSVSQLFGNASGRMSSLLSGSALRQSGCLKSTLAMAVLVMPASLIVECNDAFVECGGWSREQLLQSVIRPPTDHPISPHSAAHPKPGGAGHFEMPCQAERRVCPLMMSRHGRGRGAARYVSQYGSSMKEMGALFAGLKHKIECVWRTRAASGELYEVHMTAWLEYDSAECRDAHKQKGALVMGCRMVTAHSMYDKVKVEEAEEGVGMMQR